MELQCEEQKGALQRGYSYDQAVYVGAKEDQGRY